MKGYSAAVGFLFTDARVNGSQGEKVVNDCEGARSPWQKKGQMEKYAEKQNVRDDPGEYIGNPMETETIKNHKGAAEKEARRAGQHSQTSADVTPEILSSLYNALVASHCAPRVVQPPVACADSSAPATSSEGDPGSCSTPAASGAAQSVDAAARGAANSNLSQRQTDYLTYVFYAFLFKTLARPLTLLNLKYKDITLSDLFVAANEQFQNRYVVADVALRSCNGQTNRVLECHMG